MYSDCFLYCFQEYPGFWPKKGEQVDHGGFKVCNFESEESCQGKFVTKDFLIQATQDEYQMICRMIQCPGWPESCSPTESVFDLVKVVQEWHLEYQNGPIIVIDR